MHKVSVIIPVYGVEKYIEKCARQLFEQTLDDIEYLFIDDCTPDKSIEVLKHVMVDYPHRKGQIIIHRMDHNSGQAKVREWGMRHATGEFLIHCDSDDWPEKNQYELMYYAAIQKEADLVFCDYNRVYNDERIENNHRCIVTDKKESLIRKMLCGYNDANQLWGCLVKRNLIDLIVYPKGNLGEDRAIMLQLIYHSNKMIYIEKPLYNYNINPCSLLRSTSSQKLIEKTNHAVWNIELILKFLNDVKLLDSYSKEIVSLKFAPRVILSVGLIDKECRKKWYSVFPTINRDVFSNPYISKLSKMKELMMRLHLGYLYGLLYSFYSKKYI